MRAIKDSALHADFCVVGDHEGTLQLMPPLIIDRETLDRGLAILVDCIRAQR